MVGSTTNTVAYEGNGSTSTPYAIPFRYDATSWIVVTVKDADDLITVLEQGTDYTLSGDGAASTGQFVTATAYDDTHTVTVWREAPGLQTLDLTPNTPLPAASLESQLDRLAMAVTDRLTPRAVDDRILAIGAPGPTGPTGPAGTVDNADIIAAIEEDPAATRGGLKLSDATKPRVGTIAFMGDSITAQSGSSNVPANLSALGYATWARVYNGQRWDFQKQSASLLTFATAGYTTTQIGTTYLPLVEDSGADVCVVHEGTNNYSGGTTAQATADAILAHWLAIRAAGIMPVGTSILPVVGDATKSSWIVATNAILRTHAEANNVLFCDWTGLIENVTESNTGVGNTTYTPDNIHPGVLGAQILGKYIAGFIEARFVLTGEPWEGIECVTPNPRFAGGSGQPTSWQAPSVPASGTLNTKTVVAESTHGGRWWTLDVTQGAATGSFGLSLDFTVLASIVGETVLAQCDIEVVSGTFSSASIRCNATNSTYDNFYASTTAAASITAADGVMTLRTMPQVVPGGNVYYTATINFTGTGVIRVRRAGLFKSA